MMKQLIAQMTNMMNIFTLYYLNLPNKHLTIWNGNGLSRHLLELKKFLNEKQIDVMLIFETHSTEKTI